MKLMSGLFVVFIIAALTSCSNAVVQNRDKHYLTAHSVPPLKIPPGIASSAFHTEYPVSDRQYSEEAKEVSIVPPGLNQ